jgi:hypothetical protein
MGLTSETIVFQRGRFRREPPFGGVLRVGRRARIRHVYRGERGKEQGGLNGGITTVRFKYVVSLSSRSDSGSVIFHNEFVAWHLNVPTMPNRVAVDAN